MLIAFQIVSLLLLVASVAMTYRLGFLKGFGVVVAATICGLFGNIDRVASFTASVRGIDAKLFQVDQTIDAGNKVIAQIRSLTKEVIENSIDSEVRIRAFGGALDYARQSKAIDALLDYAKTAGLDEAAMAEIERHLKPFYAGIYFMGILNAGLTGATPDEQNKWNELFGKAVASAEPLRPSDIQAFMDGNHINNDFARELLKDYEIYTNTGEQPDKGLWARREDWLGPYKSLYSGQPKNQ